MDRLDRMLALVRREIPDLRLVDKHDSALMRAVGAVIRPFNPDFTDGYTTVIGATVYLPRPVDRIPRDGLAATLAHELVHQLDQRDHPLWFYVSYGVALPVGRTMRAHWERRGYAVDLMLAHERGGDSGLDRKAAWVADLFAGPSYGWMWAGKAAARAYLAPVVAGVRAGTVQAAEPYRGILAAWRGEP